MPIWMYVFGFFVLLALGLIAAVLWFLLPHLKQALNAEPAGEDRSGSEQAGEELPYRRRDWLFTKAERSFFGVLQSCAGDRYLIFAKVRLADLLWMPRGASNRKKHQNRINPRHVDFVLCDPDTVRPLLAIELDDASHERADRRQRDTFLDAALSAAGLPLLRIPARQAYAPKEIAAQIEAAVGAGESAAPVTP